MRGADEEELEVGWPGWEGEADCFVAEGNRGHALVWVGGVIGGDDGFRWVTGYGNLPVCGRRDGVDGSCGRIDR